ncbi:hypothetical protein [Streptomyces somaliensis]|uniref:hypothetical protein n=1 Tax=Streptomyces somaliensis TaxID=78355 RepID=UPI0034E94013|nr:hypothetical protein [Streptomyces somaliensis]
MLLTRPGPGAARRCWCPSGTGRPATRAARGDCFASATAAALADRALPEGAVERGVAEAAAFVAAGGAGNPALWRRPRPRAARAAGL